MTSEGWGRRSFLKVTGGAALAASFGTWAFRSRAGMRPAEASFGFLTDTFLSPPGEGKDAGKMGGGLMYGHALTLAQDVVSAMAEKDPGLGFIVHGGGFSRPAPFGTNPAPPAGDLISSSSLEIICPGAGKGLESWSKGGVTFIRLAEEKECPRRVPSRLYNREAQLAGLEEVLADATDSLVVIVSRPPLIEVDKAKGFAADDRDALLDIFRRHPQVSLVLSGKALANGAGRIPGGPLNLVTCSTAAYPCGARTVSVASRDGEVTARSDFVQSRRQDLVEESFHNGGPPKPLANLGERADRRLVLTGSGEIEAIVSGPGPNLAPFWRERDEVTLAVASDTHLCLDRFVDEDESKNYELIGHFPEEGSKMILEDVIDQIVSGRHRVEFYDEVFLSSPSAEANYVEAPVDALLFCGDLTEHGEEDEALLFRSYLQGLPGRVREKTLVTVGNHDAKGTFAENGPASSSAPISNFYEGFGPRDGKVDYVQRLTDWLTLVVLDSTIPTHSNLGFSQDKIDWLEDVLSSREGEAVLIASHHPIYPLSIVPPLMNAYLKSRYHFTRKRSAARMQLQRLFARHGNVKAVISGHYHGVVVDAFKKASTFGAASDDGSTVHFQVPCTIEYPNGYRVFKARREGNKASLEYFTAYTREAELRARSSRATIFKVLGTRPSPGGRYLREPDRAGRDGIFEARLAMPDPYDLSDLNVRGFKDGTAMGGKGKGGKANIRGLIEFTL